MAFGSNYSTAGEVAAAAPATPVSDALQRNYRELDELHATISDLEVRLQIVLRPTSDGGAPGAEKGGPAAPAVSLLVDNVLNQADRCLAARRRIENLMKQLDC